MRWILAILSLLFIFVDADQHLNENGPFGKRHNFGDLPSPYACNRGSGIVSRLFRRRFQAVQLMNVSKTFYASSEPIEVTWTPLSEACKDDFVGVFYSEATDESACDYFDFEFIQPKQSSTTWAMTNLRRPLDFRYYSRDRKCLGNYTLIAKSPIVQPANANEATHVHIAYGDRVDQIYVSYLTNSSQYTPKCQYGLSPTSLTMVQTGTTTTYKASDMCEAKATIVGPKNFIDPGFMHTMLLEDLRASTTYYYRVGTDEHGWSQVYSFTNRPADKQEPVYIIAYGDMGLAPVEPGAKSTLERLITRVNSTNVTSVLHIGDISYARGVGALWDAFMTQVEPIAARVPYMTSIGNMNMIMKPEVTKIQVMHQVLVDFVPDGVIMEQIQAVNVLFQWFIDFILHRMETVYFGIVLMSVQLTFCSIQSNMTFVQTHHNTILSKKIFVQ